MKNLVIATWNAAIGASKYTESLKERCAAFAQLCRAKGVDVLCLQEAPSGDDYGNVILQEFPDFPYQHSMDYGPEKGSLPAQKLVILSRLPFTKGVAEAPPSGGRSVSRDSTGDRWDRKIIWARLRLRGTNDTLLVANTHGPLSDDEKDAYADACAAEFAAAVDRGGMGVIVGDFNQSMDNMADASADLVDVWETHHPTDGPRATPPRPRYMDGHVANQALVTRGGPNAGIRTIYRLGDVDHGITPNETLHDLSDHYGVVAEYNLRHRPQETSRWYGQMPIASEDKGKAEYFTCVGTPALCGSGTSAYMVWQRSSSEGLVWTRRDGDRWLPEQGVLAGHGASRPAVTGVSGADGEPDATIAAWHDGDRGAIRWTTIDSDRTGALSDTGFESDEGPALCTVGSGTDAERAVMAWRGLDGYLRLAGLQDDTWSENLFGLPPARTDRTPAVAALGEDILVLFRDGGLKSFQIRPDRLAPKKIRTIDGEAGEGVPALATIVHPTEESDGLISAAWGTGNAWFLTADWNGDRWSTVSEPKWRRADDNEQNGGASSDPVLVSIPANADGQRDILLAWNGVNDDRIWHIRMFA